MSAFMKSVESTIVNKISSYKGKDVDYDLSRLIFGDIFDTFATIFENVGSKTNVRLSNETINWLSQRLYDDVKVNGNMPLDPNIFDKRASLKNVPTTDLAVLIGILRGHAYVEEIVEEMKSRN